MFRNQSLDFALAAIRRSEILRPTRGWSSRLGLGGRVAHEVAQLDQAFGTPVIALPDKARSPSITWF